MWKVCGCCFDNKGSGVMNVDGIDETLCFVQFLFVTWLMSGSHFMDRYSYPETFMRTSYLATHELVHRTQRICHWLVELYYLSYVRSVYWLISYTSLSFINIILYVLQFVYVFRVGLKKVQGTGPVDSSLIDTESAIMNTFDFLARENVVDDDEENLR